MDTNIQKYVAFITTVERKGFAKAAMFLHYSQSGISRMIKDLEKQWGIVLVERDKKDGTKLTSEGIKLLPFVKNIVEEYKKLQLEVNNLNGLQSGLIRIAVLSSVATNQLPTLIKDFQKTHQNIEYEILSGGQQEVEGLLLSGQVDCAFVRISAHPQIETSFLEQDEFVAVLPYNHLLLNQQQNSISLRALCEEPFILYSSSNSDEISELFEKQRIKPNIQFTTSDEYVIMSMVESGLGVSILPQQSVKRKIFRLATKKITTPAYRNIGLATNKKRTTPPLVKQFIKYICERYKTDIEGGSSNDTPSSPKISEKIAPGIPKIWGL